WRSRTRLAGSIPRVPPDGFLEGLIADASRPGAVRALAVRHLRDPARHADMLMNVARQASVPSLRIESIRSLASVDRDEVAALLASLARDTDEPEAVRAEALTALGWHASDRSQTIVDLLADPAAEVRFEAARY